MVREYVERLYTPAAHAHRTMSVDTARELALWKQRVRSTWHAVRVDHVETAVATTTAELGTTLALRVRVDLGDLTPDDVEVQAVAGRVDEEDRITDATKVPLKPAGGPDTEGRWLYEGPCPWTAPDPTATRSASSPPTDSWPPGRSWAWWRCRPRRRSRERECCCGRHARRGADGVPVGAPALSCRPSRADTGFGARRPTHTETVSRT